MAWKYSFYWGDHMQSAVIMAGRQRLSLDQIYNATDLGRPAARRALGV